MDVIEESLDEHAAAPPQAPGQQLRLALGGGALRLRVVERFEFFAVEGMGENHIPGPGRASVVAELPQAEASQFGRVSQQAGLELSDLRREARGHGFS
jgi:hypothetical protein